MIIQLSPANKYVNITFTVDIFFSQDDYIVNLSIMVNQLLILLSPRNSILCMVMSKHYYNYYVTRDPE